jgi:hypothetical protein
MSAPHLSGIAALIKSKASGLVTGGYQVCHHGNSLQFTDANQVQNFTLSMWDVAGAEHYREARAGIATVGVRQAHREKPHLRLFCLTGRL